MSSSSSSTIINLHPAVLQRMDAAKIMLCKPEYDGGVREKLMAELEAGMKKAREAKELQDFNRKREAEMAAAQKAADEAEAIIVAAEEEKLKKKKQKMNKAAAGGSPSKESAPSPSKSSSAAAAPKSSSLVNFYARDVDPRFSSFKTLRDFMGKTKNDKQNAEVVRLCGKICKVKKDFTNKKTGEPTAGEFCCIVPWGRAEDHTLQYFWLVACVPQRAKEMTIAQPSHAFSPLPLLRSPLLQV